MLGCPYHDAPVLSANPFVKRSIGGVRAFDRAKWFNIHGNPEDSEWTAEDVATFSGLYRAHLGRAFSVTSRMKEWAGVQEDPLRPGYAEPSSLADSCDMFPGSLKHWPIEAVDVVVSAKTEGLFANGCGLEAPAPFVPGSFDAAAEFFSRFAASCLTPSKASRVLIEVGNECDIKYTTSWRPGCNVSWAGMVELHAMVADRVHADAAAMGYPREPLVCGPTTAWPEFQLNDFADFREKLGPFIEGAGRSVDCISTHLCACGASQTAV
jgi:hypothetical protein